MYLQCWQNSQGRTFLTIQGTSALLQWLCMTFVPIAACQHFARLTGKERRRKKDDEQVCMSSEKRQKRCLEYLAFHKHIFSSFKGLYQCRYYCRERLYSQISLTAKKKRILSRLPLRCHIAKLATFSVDPGILISLYASAHHPYTTLAVRKWMIFRLGQGSLLKSGPLM